MEQRNINHPGANPPVIFNSVNDCYKGTVWVSNEGLHYVVLQYNSKFDIIVKCIEIGNIMSVKLYPLRTGSIKNNYLRGKYGGYFGDGKYTKHGNIKAYLSWTNMLRRTSIEGQINNIRNISYIGVSVYDQWYNFQIFAEWFEKYISQLNPEYYNDYQLDKDILTFNNHNIRMYSPDTCSIVPSAINFALASQEKNRTEDLPTGVHKNSENSYSINISTGNSRITYIGVYKNPEDAFLAYKKAKENYLHELADFYYNKGCILKNVYDALYNINIVPYKNKLKECKSKNGSIN